LAIGSGARCEDGLGRELTYEEKKRIIANSMMREMN